MAENANEPATTDDAPTERRAVGRIVAYAVAGACVVAVLVSGRVVCRRFAEPDHPGHHEALAWLAAAGDPHPLAPRRFPTWQKAVDFVGELYSSGAKDVFIKDTDIETTSRGKRASALVVILEDDPNARRAFDAAFGDEIRKYGDGPPVGSSANWRRFRWPPVTRRPPGTPLPPP